MREVLPMVPGQRFSRLIVVERAGNSVHGHAIWLCLCDCGGMVKVRGACLKNGRVSSCGCLKAEKSSALKSHHPLRYVWRHMIQRCYNPKTKMYYRYGGRGIEVCPLWHVFSNFASDMGERPRGFTLERINNDGNYEPSNCRWATRYEQMQNISTNVIFDVNGCLMTCSDLAKSKGISARSIKSRLHRGWSIERALSTPIADPFGRHSVKKDSP